MKEQSACPHRSQARVEPGIAIAIVAGDRMTGVSGVHADLVCSSGRGQNFHQCGLRTEMLYHAKTAQRGFSLRIDSNEAFASPPYG